MKYTITNTIDNLQTHTTTTNANNNINNINIVNIDPTSSSSSSSTTSSLSASSASSSTSSSCLSATSSTTTTNGGNGCGNTTATNTTGGNSLFREQVNTVTNFFEKWNDCERAVVMYTLVKRLRYSSLKFLQYSIDNTLTQNMDSTSNLSTVVVDMNANNSSYLQNLLNAYKTFHLSDLVDTLSSSSSSDKDSMPCYGSDFQITTNCDERKLYSKKEDILHEVLNMLPLLKPGNEEAKLIYLSLIPLAVKDAMRQIVPIELVQQIFSYMLIHPAVSTDDRRTLNVWLSHLEEHMQNFNNGPPSVNLGIQPPMHANFMQNQNSLVSSFLVDNHTNTSMTTSGSSSGASISSSTLSISSTASNGSVASSSFGNLTQNCTNSSSNTMLLRSRSNDWQTIQPPSRQQQQVVKNTLASDWSPLAVVKPNTTANNSSGNVIINGGSSSSCVAGGVGLVVGSNNADQLCDNFNGITLNDLASSQNSLGLNIGGRNSIVEALVTADSSSSSLVNGVAAAAASATASSAAVPATATTPNIFGPQTNPIINIINNNNNNCSGQLNNGIIDDHDTSFSKNGTEILDFEPNLSTTDSCCNSNSSNSGSVGQLQSQQQLGYASILMNNCSDHLDITRWSLDSKFAALKTRRSNSLTTQTISSSASSSNSSVITVNDNCSNSTENLAQFVNKPRSYSLSIEHHRGSLTNSGSDTRLDDFKPNYIKFQTRNVGMSNIGLWLKSLRLHKYIDLFKNMTYEDMMQITEEYLQSLGVTKGASHKLALCIEKLKDRCQHLTKMEQELINGQLKLQAAVEELANIVLTPMKPIELVNATAGEDNVALSFLKVIDLVCTIAQKDPYAVVDDDNISVILWILDRTIHNEAFVNHANQLKELKFKLSKLKMSMTPKIHHSKNGSNGNLNKPRWNGKSRKCDQKNGSNDRINHRKNSNDMINFSLSCLQQQHHHNQQQQQQQQQQINEYDKYNNNNNNNNNNSNNNNNNNNNNQYKNSAYQNYQQQQQQQQINHQQQMQQQQQLQPQILQQKTHFPALPQQQQQPQPQHNPQHRRSLNSLIVVPGGPQQPQKMIFKPGQGILSTTSNENDMTTEVIKSNQQQQQQSRKASLTSLNNNNNNNNLDHMQQQQSNPTTTLPFTKKTMAAVMVSNDDLMHATTPTTAVAANVAPPPPPPQILITANNNTQTQNNTNNIHHNNLMQQQQQQQHVLQQQQLQLLAAAAAAVGNSCNLNVANMVNCNSNCNSSSGTGAGANVVHVVGNSSSNVGSSSSNNNILHCNNNNSNNNINNNNNNCKNNHNTCNNCSISNCNSHPLQIISALPQTSTTTNLNLKLPSLSEYHQHNHQQHHHPQQHHPHHSASPTINDVLIASSSLNHTINATTADTLNDITGFEQLETLCLQMTEQAIN